MLDTYHPQAKRKLTATIISLIIIAGIVVLVDRSHALRSTNTASTTPASQTATSGMSATGSATSPISSGSSSSSYKDGTYTASSSYYVPRSQESIAVNVTLQSGVVTGVSIQNSETDPESAQFQENFAAAYKSYVVGKSISGLRLHVISGASETTQGFNDALSQITAKAQA